MAVPSPIRERLLGGFVCFQLVMIPLANCIKLVPVRLPMHRGELNGDLQNTLLPGAPVREPIQTVKDWTAYSLARYAEVSGQSQCWALFATFPEQGALPVVELHWPDRPSVELKSHFDPLDPTRYFYLPEPCCRQLSYEYRVVISIFTADLGELARNPGGFRDESRRQVREMHRSTAAFLRWKTAQYLREHPDCPPPEHVDLTAHVMPNPRPGDSRTARPPEFRMPVARCYPGRPVDATFLPIDCWDGVEGRYVRLKAIEESP